MGYKKVTPGRKIAEESAAVPTSISTKTIKSSKPTSTGFKVKVPAKKTPQISMHKC